MPSSGKTSYLTPGPASTESFGVLDINMVMVMNKRKMVMINMKMKMSRLKMMMRMMMLTTTMIMMMPLTVIMMMVRFFGGAICLELLLSRISSSRTLED